MAETAFLPFLNVTVQCNRPGSGRAPVTDAFPPASVTAPFFPSGNYRVSRPLTLRSETALIGLNPGTTQQFYPLTFAVFWIEYHLWGLHPAGYHAVQVLLHGLNAVLLAIALETLGVSGAWITAWIFALHPVQVESVAWMTSGRTVWTTEYPIKTLDDMAEKVGSAMRSIQRTPALR